MFIFLCLMKSGRYKCFLLMRRLRARKNVMKPPGRVPKPPAYGGAGMDVGKVTRKMRRMMMSSSKILVSSSSVYVSFFPYMISFNLSKRVFMD